VRPLVRSLRPAAPIEPPAVAGPQPALVGGGAEATGQLSAVQPAAQLEPGSAEADATPTARPLLEHLSGLVADRPDDAVRVIRVWLKQR
jgi:flagellar biosynthesis/type III secretory pathway M-ring protein FliF/YscJ